LISRLFVDRLVDHTPPAESSGLPSKRRGRWRRRLALPFVFLVLLAGLLVFLSWSASSDLSDIIAELDRRDPGWRLEDIEAHRKPMPNATNSALQILAIGGGGVWTPEMDKMFDNLQPQVELSLQQAAFLEKRLEVLRASVDLARKLKDMPDGRFPIKYCDDFFSTTAFMVPNIQKAREVADLLQWDACRRVHAGDADGALESCLALQHVARAAGEQPMLIAGLVRNACDAIAVMAIERTLAQGQLTEASEPILKRVQAALTREARDPMLVTALRGERAGLHRYYQALADGKTRGLSAVVKTQNSVPFTQALEAAIEKLPGFSARQHAAQLKLYTSVLEALQLPQEKCDEWFDALGKRADTESLLLPQISAVVKVRQADLRTRAYLYSAVAALGAERFRLAHNRWPQTLAELVKTGFLETVSADPYDGKPLRLKSTAGGLVIYSVGPDRTDNGGTIDPERSLQPGTDVGFRLWNTSRRRQPPNPPVPIAD
jgi:hypothetical protein